MPSNITYMVTLACHHVVEYMPIPQVGKLLYCRRCTTWRKCLHIEQSWRWACDTKRCTVGRGYGTDEGRARRMAVRHLRLEPSHDVWLYKGNSPIEKIKSSQPTLPIVT